MHSRLRGQPINAAAFALLLPSLSASAATSVVQTAAPAPTYGVTLNYDEVGGPPGGLAAPVNSWSASHGILIADQGNTGGQFVGNFNASYPWLPNNNVAFGTYGLWWEFSTDLTAISFQAWDRAGPPGPTQGGLYVRLYNDDVQVGQHVFTPAWGGVGNTWYNVTTSGGTVFDFVHVTSSFFFPNTYVDNLSWNVVPGPGALAMLGLAGIVGARRRRR